MNSLSGREDVRIEKQEFPPADRQNAVCLPFFTSAKLYENSVQEKMNILKEVLINT